MRWEAAPRRAEIATGYPFPAALIIAILFLLPLAATAQEPTSDVPGEIRARVESYAEAWNTHRASAVAAFFTADADMILGNGPRLTGREAIEQVWATYFSHIDAGREGGFAIESFRSLTPHVALLEIDSTTAGHTAAGEQLPTRLARGTWVMVRRDGVWWIAALRGLPAEGAARVAPGRDH